MTAKESINIGQRVKTLREGQSLTQKELADMVAISPSSIARLESGETMTSVSTLLKIAEALNTSISSIVASANENIQFQDEICKQPLSAASRAAFPGQSRPY